MRQRIVVRTLECYLQTESAVSTHADDVPPRSLVEIGEASIGSYPCSNGLKHHVVSYENGHPITDWATWIKVDPCIAVFTTKAEQYDESLKHWWKEYADRKNDEEEEHVSDSLLYDYTHLPRSTPAPTLTDDRVKKTESGEKK